MVHVVQVRVDAARNRERITTAARDLIARDGPDVTMDALAKRAGVAVGTLYRHFPTKSDLVGAVVEESIGRIAELTEAAVRCVESGAAPADELAAVFRVVAAEQPSDRAVKEAAAALGVAVDVQLESPEPGTVIARAAAALTRLLAAAHTAGSIDPAVTVDDLAMLLTQVPADPSGRARERYVDIVLAGLLIRH